MATIKKTGTHTSDRVNVGTKVNHAKSMGAARGGASKNAGATYHGGQPQSLGGSGLMTGHSKTNC